MPSPPSDLPRGTHVDLASREAAEQAEVRVKQLLQERVDATAALATLKEEARRLMSGACGDSALVAGRLAGLTAQVEEQERALTRAGEEIDALSPRVGSEGLPRR